MDLSTLLHQFVEHVADTPKAAWACTIGVVVLWCVVWQAAWKRGAQHLVAIIVATLYCLISEYLAIQLGKYHYAAFPLSIPEFSVPGLHSLLTWLGSFGIIPAPLEPPQGISISRHVPVEIALLEGTLLYGVFRITTLLSPQRPPGEWRLRTTVPWVRSRWANPVLNGFLALSLDAMLDPIVSRTMSFESGLEEPGLGLWTWHTNAHYAGHWFGVPLANYNAWFAALFAFTAATRLGRTSVFIGDQPLFTRGKLIGWAILKALGLLTGLLFLVKFSLDYVTYEMFHLFGAHTPAAWQFTVVGILIALGLVGARQIARQAVKENTVNAEAFELGAVAAIAFVFAYCAGALIFGGMFRRNPWFAALWLVTAVIAGVHAAAPWRRKRQPVSAPPPVVMV